MEWRGKGRPNPSRETEIPDANCGRENIIFSGWLTTSRIGNYTRLIYTLLKVLNITYIQSPPLGLSPLWPPYAPPPQIERRPYLPGGGDVTVFGTFEVFVRPEVDLPDMVEFGLTEIVLHEILATTGM